jgi:hypothetical protein
MLLGFVVLVACRMPNVLRGRFWAEDGFFFLDALRLPLFEALTAPHTGYLNLVASLAGQAARLMPLEFAPVASCAVALAVQTLPALLLVTSRIPWLQSRTSLILALLLVATPPLSEEVWINAITGQYHLMLCVGLILAEDTRKGTVRILHFGILAMASLAGPGSAFLIPLYAMRAWRDRAKVRGWQTLFLSAGALVQLAVLTTHPEPNRHLGIEPDLLLAVVYVKHLLVPFLGRQALDLSGPLHSLFVAGGTSLLPIVTVLGAGGAFGFALWRSGNRESRWLAAGGLVMMILSYFGALDGRTNLLGIHFGMRYTFAPQVLFELALLGVACTTWDRIRAAAGLAIVWLVIVGLYGFFRVSPEMASGPSWRAQVLERATEAGASIELWPRHMTIRLPPDT